MHILLPPSEAKNPGGRGKSLSARAGDSELDSARQHVLTALAEAVRSPDAATSLLLPPSVAEAALDTNRRAAVSATMPALRRYAGVVYDGLAAQELCPQAARLARRNVLIFSGLLGVSRGGDPVPDYRVPAKAVLPGIGVVGTFWRRKLATIVPALLGRAWVLDLRSSDYAAMWQPAADSALARRLITARILSRTPSGRWAVVSYSSKLAKGRLARAVLEHQATFGPLTAAEQLCELWLTLGGSDAKVLPGGPAPVLELRDRG